MKKLLMLLLVLVFSFALCLSVSAHDTEPADTPPTETEVTEAANASGGCNHVNYDDSGKPYIKGGESTYCGPTMCRHSWYVDIKCADCGAFLWSQFIEYTFTDHSWIEHFTDDGKECDFCSMCGYHTRIH